MPFDQDSVHSFSDILSVLSFMDLFISLCEPNYRLSAHPVRLVKYMCSKEQRSTAIAQAVGHHLRKEVIFMPITLAFHVFGLTITVTVKSNNRHLSQVTVV